MKSRGYPVCPNHGCPLMLEDSQKMERKGAARCQVSGVMFSFQQEVKPEAMEKDKYGNVMKTYEVEDKED